MSGEIILHCQRGRRSYFAGRILSPPRFSRAQPDRIIPPLEDCGRPERALSARL